MDNYSLKARVYPVILVILPILLLGIFYSIQLESYLQTIAGVSISTVLYFLFSQLGRDRGKNIERKLWENWGGTPTTQMFRFSNQIINEDTKKVYHNDMNELVKSSNIPSVELEKVQPQMCDNIYGAWTKYLIGKTRDTEKYKLLFTENINYGFRRNTLGLKPIGIIISILLSLVIWIYSYSINMCLDVNDKNSMIAQAIILIPLFFWIFIVNKKWVKIPAFAYAERLLETISLVKNENTH